MRSIGIDGLDLVVSPSIGIALFPDNATTGAELIALADATMYRARRQSRGYVFRGRAERMDGAIATHS